MWFYSMYWTYELVSGLLASKFVQFIRLDEHIVVHDVLSVEFVNDFVKPKLKEVQLVQLEAGN